MNLWIVFSLFLVVRKQTSLLKFKIGVYITVQYKNSPLSNIFVAIFARLWFLYYFVSCLIQWSCDTCNICHVCVLHFTQKLNLCIVFSLVLVVRKQTSLLKFKIGNWKPHGTCLRKRNFERFSSFVLLPVLLVHGFIIILLYSWFSGVATPVLCVTCACCISGFIHFCGLFFFMIWWRLDSEYSNSQEFDSTLVKTIVGTRTQSYRCKNFLENAWKTSGYTVVYTHVFWNQNIGNWEKFSRKRV